MKRAVDPVVQNKLLAQYYPGTVIQVGGVNVKVLQAVPQQKDLLLVVEDLEKIIPAQTMLHVRPDGQIADLPEGWKISKGGKKRGSQRRPQRNRP